MTTILLIRSIIQSCVVQIFTRACYWATITAFRLKTPLLPQRSVHGLPEIRNFIYRMRQVICFTWFCFDIKSFKALLAYVLRDRNVVSIGEEHIYLHRDNQSTCDRIERQIQVFFFNFGLKWRLLGRSGKTQRGSILQHTRIQSK